jgi:PEGA domain
VHRRAIGLALAAAWTLLPCAAYAEDAEALVTRGLELRVQGKDDQALVLFKRADALAPSPRTRAQVALAEQALGIWVSAEAHLGAALAAKNDPWIEKNRAALSAALDVVKQHVGSLEVLGGAPGAEVIVDGAKLGVLPMAAPWRIEVGRRSLEIHAPGYHSASRATEIVAGRTTRETIELVREQPSAPGAAAAGGAPPPRIVVQPDPGSTQRIVGWIGVGTGAALLAAGVIGLVARQSAISSYNDDVACPGRSSALQPTQCQDYVSSANSWRTVSIVGFIGGGVLTVGGIVLVATAPSAKPTAFARASCGTSGLGLVCAGSF